MEYPIVDEIFGYLCRGYGFDWNVSHQLLEAVDDHNQVAVAVLCANKFSQFVDAHGFEWAVFRE